MFTMYFHGNLSVLCCKCQLLSYFIGYYFCFMEQFSHPALDDSGLTLFKHQQSRPTDEHTAQRGAYGVLN